MAAVSDRLNYRRPIEDSEIPEGAERCTVCEGYKVLVQASLEKLLVAPLHVCAPIH
ncbi:MAG: hypothetical protein U0X20_07975 [Caldilineaceae bacterium]